MPLENEALLATAADAGLHLKPETLRFNESGLDFRVSFADDNEGNPWVLRCPRRANLSETLRRERTILELVGPRLPIRVPEWKVVRDDLVAYRRLPGTPLSTTNVQEGRYDWHVDWYEDGSDVPEVFIESLATALASLHRLDLGAARDAGLPTPSISDVRRQQAEEIERVVREVGASSELRDRWQRWLDDDTYWPERPGFVHGDLHAAHILTDTEGRVTGLIDWTEAGVKDASTDFFLLSFTFPAPFSERLLVGYEDAGGEVWPRMRDHIAERWAAYPVQIGLFALESGDEAMLSYARTKLGGDPDANA